MPQSKKVYISLLITVEVLVAGLAAFKILHKSTLNTYKDEQSIIYDCSQPIKAKKGTVPDLFGGRMDAMIPADQNEAKRYCHASGVE